MGIRCFFCLINFRKCLTEVPLWLCFILFIMGEYIFIVGEYMFAMGEYMFAQGE